MGLLTIGAFARAARLTPKALRLYGELGLLRPAAVDPESGYRLYDPRQLRWARLIAQLRGIGMPLAEIRALSGRPPSEVADAVAAYGQRVTADNADRARQTALLVEHLSGKGDTMSFHSSAACDTGAVRETNQDAAFAGDRILAVADGGGGPAGAAASAAAIEAVTAVPWADVPESDLLTHLAAAVSSADRTIRAGETHPISTLTALVRRDSRLALVHVGDTRAYLLRDGELSQLTHDHTWVQTQVDAGLMPQEEAITHPQRALLVRALGAGEVEADLAVRTAHPGDRYLLCSDGLSTVVDRRSLQEALAAAGTPDETVQRLIALAHSKGAPDNIACVVADVVAP